MSQLASFIEELVKECAATRRILERVPEDQFGWKPHDKSMGLGRLASHIAENPKWAAWVINDDVFAVGPDTYSPFLANDRDELLKTLDMNVIDARKALEGADVNALGNAWRMTWEGNIVIEAPRMEVLRSFLVSHLIHHRGQLTVYLRMLDVPLPQIYGPTADEQM